MFVSCESYLWNPNSGHLSQATPLLRTSGNSLSFDTNAVVTEAASYPFNLINKVNLLLRSTSVAYGYFLSRKLSILPDAQLLIDLQLQKVGHESTGDQKTDLLGFLLC